MTNKQIIRTLYSCRKKYTKKLELLRKDSYRERESEKECEIERVIMRARKEKYMNTINVVNIH